MSIRIASYKRGGFMVDIRARLTDGRKVRDRRVLDMSRSSVQRWADERLAYLLTNGPGEPTQEVPTLREFWPRYVQNHMIANKLKPTTRKSAEGIYRNHFEPLFGDVRLDKIRHEQVQELKASLKSHEDKTVNNILAILSRLLRRAVDWGAIDKMPCKVELVKVAKEEMEFFEADQLGRLVQAAGRLGTEHLCIVLLGADAGLRAGEMVGLEWGDLDLKRRIIHVRRGETIPGEVTTTKGNKARRVTVPPRLLAALQAHRHLRGPRVFYQTDGRKREHVTWSWIRHRFTATLRLAGLPSEAKGVHKLRHTFGARLAMAGYPAIAIKNAMGHASITTTEKYMHLSPKFAAETVVLDTEPWGNSEASPKAKAATS